jgi:hypothetical protein
MYTVIQNSSSFHSLHNSTERKTNTFLFGELLLQTKTFIGWCLAGAVGFTLVYCTHTENKKNGTTWSREFRAVYESLGRPLWAACVAWVVAACHYGRGGRISNFQWLYSEKLRWHFIPRTSQTFIKHFVFHTWGTLHFVYVWRLE